MCSSNIWFFPTLSATTIAMEAVTKEHMEDRAVDMVVVDMEDTASSSHTSSQHHLQEDTVSNTRLFCRCSRCCTSSRWCCCHRLFCILCSAGGLPAVLQPILWIPGACC
ncbi:hypothetical protein F5H01DRAFT_129399 [Linnemannia elongata]|nr:hypothetical protein F5H01DRAFT_129399 [Linnemannia elongata]